MDDFNKTKQAAERGDAQAQYALGNMYHAGKGVKKSLAEAIYWYRCAAQQDNPWAQFSLGMAYATGDGVPKSHGFASEWLSQAAKSRYVEIKFDLGEMYYTGNCMVKNYCRAAAWYREAAEYGHIIAALKLSAMYRKGEGVPQDQDEADKWLNNAAIWENEDFCTYYPGLDSSFHVDKEIYTAVLMDCYISLLLKASEGDARAQSVLSIVEERLTPDQINSAQQMASHFAIEIEIREEDS